jgi:hypothetical protein
MHEESAAAWPRRIALMQKGTPCGYLLTPAMSRIFLIKTDRYSDIFLRIRRVSLYPI